MGCWNATCGLTHLPIFYDQPVVAMIIQEQDSTDYTPSYAWTRWSPASALVRGTYNDYGDVDLDDNALAVLKLSQDDASSVGRWFRNATVGDDASEDEKWDYAMVKVPTFIAEDEPDEHHRSRSRLSQRRGSGFALWMAHAGAFDELCQTIDPDDFRNDTKTARELAEFRAAEIVKKDMETRAGGKEARLFRFDDGWSLRGEGSYSAAIRAISDIQRQLIAADEFDQTTYDFTKGLWLDLHCLNTIMDALRITLSPTGGVGSQRGDMQNYSALTRIMNNQIKANLARWDDEDYEEEEEVAAS